MIDGGKSYYFYTPPFNNFCHVACKSAKVFWINFIVVNSKL